MYNCLLDLQQQLNSPAPEISRCEKTLTEIESLFSEVREQLSDAELTPPVLAKIQPLNTELNRALRLLKTDLLFLRSSKQEKTQKSRLTTIRERLKQLERLLELVLREVFET